MSIINNTLQKGRLAISVSAVVVAVYASRAHNAEARRSGLLHTTWAPPEDTSKNKKGGDTTNLPYPIAKPDPYTGETKTTTTLDLKQPPALQKKVELDSSMNYYKVTNSVGNEKLGDTKYVPFDEYTRQENKRYIQDYFKKRSLATVTTQNKGLLPKLNLGDGLFDDLNNLVEIRPQGSAELIFSEDFNRTQNPSWSLHEQRTAQFKFDQKIQVSVLGNIGNRFKMSIRYDTQASFDFENQRKINYQGKEDEIVKSVEVGDISMPISSSLISGSQSLFGIKTKLQFGKLDVTGVYSQQKSEKKEITLEGGAQKNNFNITADNYDANRHFFLSQYFRDHYNEFNNNWPSLSNIEIKRVEVWVTNKSNTTQNTRPLVAFMDLGESHPYNHQYIQPNPTTGLPDNDANNLYFKLNANPNFRKEKLVAQELDALQNDSFYSTQDYYVLSNARQLAPTDFTFNPKLGYISLNQALNPDDVLAVAFEYTVNGKVYRVGDFARDVSPDPAQPTVLFLKMLKSVSTRTNLPIWDLMMKNIYSLNAYQIQPTDFRLQVVYLDNRSGAYLNYLPEPDEPELNGNPLIRLMNLDRLNAQQERRPDGNFDYLEGVTINSSNGRIIFPVLEPFGSDLRKHFKSQDVANRYAFDILYDSTKTFAQQQADKNKFFLRGSYQSASGSEISLNAINVPQGSVKVFAGGVPLTEGKDYTVDYTLGRVKIINSSILNSGSVIKVESESNTLFSVQQKTLMGTHLDYHFNKDFTMGGTLLYLRERPLTPKVNIGEEPIRNAIWGLDGRYRTDSRFLTKMVDRIPLIQTKEKSDIAFEGEFAQIIPGHPKLLNDKNDTKKTGVSYLDDFEGSIVPYDLRLGNNWTLSSAPQGRPDKFPEASLFDSLAYGYKRAKLQWYTIDNIFFRDNALTPENIKGNNAVLSDPYQREVLETEVFPNKQIPNGSPGTLQTFDVVYSPTERGPYNFTVNGLDATGHLKNPKDNWAGISRRIETSDFEAANIEYVEFWVMDPFIKKPNSTGGEVYVNLGTISEDILRDNRESWENGLPTTDQETNVDTTKWAIVPKGLHLTNSFSNDANARPYQDVGYDGLTDDHERSFYSNYLNAVKNVVTDPGAYGQIQNDPANDNFHFFRGKDYDAAQEDIIRRYSQFNNTQGNTPTSIGNDNGYGTQYPDDEDINRDFNIEKSEDYFEYKIKLDPNDLVIGKNYVTDIQESNINLRNGTNTTVKWYQFKIPVRQYDRKVGSIQDFKSIRFMRIYMTGFEDSVICRFARLQLVRGDWRKFIGSLEEPGDVVTGDPKLATFDVSAVNLEENGQRPNIPYVLPPGISRETDYSTPSLIQQNEQSLSMKVCGLRKGDARAIYKTTQFDIRQYKKLEMFVHAENPDGTMKNGDLHLFIRLGADYTGNYYEYDEPLKFSPRKTDNRDEIWPSENQINLALEEFVNAKEHRQVSGVSLLYPYTEVNGTHSVTVMGNPDLGNVRAIMIGIRNPGSGDVAVSSCAEVWVNELRVSDFDEKGGWAAVGRMTTKLADFGRVELSGSRRTIGFGGIEQSLQQRSQVDARTYGLVSSFELGKFFPQKFNVRIPMYFAYSEQINRPRYNPLSPDLPLQSLADAFKESPTKRDSVLKAADDFTSRKSLNFTGVQKMRGANSKKQHFYDIENFNATWVFSEVYRRNITSTYDFEKLYSGQLGYAYSFNPKPVQPFKKLDNKYLHLVSDFNFYYLPQSVGITFRGDRKYGEKLYRNTDNIKTITAPQFDKNFTLSRKYDLRYNLTKSLRLSYAGLAGSRVEEPYGRLDSSYKRKIVTDNALKGGTLASFTQSIQVSYDVPINKLPFLDWTQLQTSYTGNFDWRTAPPAAPTLGNQIQNSQIIGLNGQFNMITLYNKNAFLRNIVSGQGNSGNNKPTVQDNTNTEPKGTKGKTPPSKKNKKGKPTTTEENPQPVQKLSIGESMVGILLSLRSASFSYTENNGILLPGFKPSPQVLGQDFKSGGPGFGFIFGLQDDIRNQAVANGWISKDPNLTSPYLTTHKTQFTGQAKLEPIKNMTINLSWNKTSTQAFSENFKYLDSLGGFAHLGPSESGQYSISFFAWNTAFIKDRKDNSSPVFEKFQDNRKEISRRLSENNPSSAQQIDPETGFYRGYDKYNQDVLIPAFLAAYSGRKASSIGLTPFPKIPAPSWQVSYSGLSNLSVIQGLVKQINLTHGYQSTYTIDNFLTSLDYNPLQIPEPGKNLVNHYRIDHVVIQERFSPLLGIDINWANNWTTHLEMRKDRTMSLSFADKRISEVRGQEFVIGAGYRTNKLILPFKVNRKTTVLNNDFNFRLDFSIRDNKNVIRILDDPQTQATGGQKLLSILPNVTYVISKNLTLNVFFKRNVNHPYTTNQYPTAFTSVGFSLRYVLTP